MKFRKSQATQIISKAYNAVSSNDEDLKVKVIGMSLLAASFIGALAVPTMAVGAALIADTTGAVLLAGGVASLSSMFTTPAFMSYGENVLNNMKQGRRLHCTMG